MTTALLISAAACLLPVLLIFEKQGKPARVLAAKTPLSALFILTALAAPRKEGAYFCFLLAGLCACLVGDVCLALPRPRMFLLGLVAFLGAHLLYLAGFYSLSGIGRWGLVATLILAAPAAVVYRWLKPHLGPMRLPVVAYIAAISLMLGAACGVAVDPRLAPDARVLLPAGALSFYLSDIFVARQRFVAPSFNNRLAGLPLYYLGQFMLAFSAAAVV